MLGSGGGHWPADQKGFQSESPKRNLLHWQRFWGGLSGLSGRTQQTEPMNRRSPGLPFVAQSEEERSVLGSGLGGGGGLRFGSAQKSWIWGGEGSEGLDSDGPGLPRSFLKTWGAKYSRSGHSRILG